MSNSSWDPTGSSPFDGQGADAPREGGWSAPSPQEGVSSTQPLPGGSTAQPSHEAPRYEQPSYEQPAFGQPGAPAAPSPEQPAYAPQPSYAQTPPPYQAAGGFQPYYQQATRDTSGAMTQLIVGIVLFTTCCGVAGLPAIICGAMGLSGGRDQEGIDKLVRTGWIVTGILVGLTVLALIAYFGFIGAMIGTAGATTSGLPAGGL